jgi:hypothetical protein
MQCVVGSTDKARFHDAAIGLHEKTRTRKPAIEYAVVNTMTTKTGIRNNLSGDRRR